MEANKAGFWKTPKCTAEADLDPVLLASSPDSLMDSDVIFLDQEARVLSSEVLGEEGPHCGGWPQSLGNEPLAPRSEPECGE